MKSKFSKKDLEVIKACIAYWRGIVTRMKMGDTLRFRLKAVRWDDDLICDTPRPCHMRDSARCKVYNCYKNCPWERYCRDCARSERLIITFRNHPTMENANKIINYWRRIK